MSTSSLGVATSLGVSSPGIGSGLDVAGIVSKLMAVESQPLTLLTTKQASYQAKLTGYGTLSGALSSFQSSLSSLSNLSTFQSLSATPADSTIFSATAATGATAGTYSVNVTQLAQAQSLTATGQTSTTAAIGTGAATTLSFSFGTVGGTLAGGTYTGGTFVQDPAQATKTVTINGTNNSLQGIRDAINAANIGVTASIVNDGSATPYRLQLTSSTGLTHSMQIAVTGDASISNLLNYDVTKAAGAGQNMNQSLVGLNANLTVNGLNVTSASNSVTSAIPGTTMNLLKTGTTSMTIAGNTSGIQSAVQSFVNAYNSANTTISSLLSYDPTTKQAGLLMGDYATMSVQAKLRSTLSQPIAGLSNTTFTNLTQLGINFQKDGSLALDSAKLQSAISTNLNDVAGMFSTMGKATDSLVSYSASTTKTVPGTYAVNVTALATQGSVLGGANLNAANTVITKGVNDTLNLTLDGNTSTVTLAAGTYTSAQLATLVQSTINGTTAFSSAGSSVAVSVNAGTGFMSILSNKYGSASNVTVAASSNAGVTLFGGAGTGTPTTGTDVTGTINGVAATGSGQYLTGATGDASEGLKLLIAGGATGARGTVSFSNGYAAQLATLISPYTATTNPSLNPISAATDGINRSLADVAKQVTAMNQHLAQIQSAYQTQFTNLDVMMGKMNTTQSYLTQQFTAMSYTMKNYG